VPLPTSDLSTNDDTDDNVSTYFVHRNILAFGERRSEYFSSLFHYAIDDGDRCTNIEIATRAADHFPQLLDYMYRSRGFIISTTNAVPLLFLAQSLKVGSLLQLVEEFLDKDVRKLYNFGTYLSDALYFSDPRIVGRVRDTGGKEVLQLTLCGSNGTLAQLLVSPLSSSASRLGVQCQTMWFFLTRFPKRLAARANRPRDANASPNNNI
jgi:BTB/POZ domain